MEDMIEDIYPFRAKGYDMIGYPLKKDSLTP